MDSWMDEGVFVPGKHCSCCHPVAETYFYNTVTKVRDERVHVGTSVCEYICLVFRIVYVVLKV